LSRSHVSCQSQPNRWHRDYPFTSASSHLPGILAKTSGSQEYRQKSPEPPSRLCCLFLRLRAGSCWWSPIPEPSLLEGKSIGTVLHSIYGKFRNEREQDVWILSWHMITWSHDGIIDWAWHGIIDWAWHMQFGRLTTVDGYIYFVLYVWPST